MLDAVADLVFPRRCAACGRRGWPFCPDCAAGVVQLVPPGCRRCGRPLDRDAERCADCPPPAVAWARSAFLYEGAVRRALMRVKFAGLESLAEALAPAVAETMAASPAPADAVLTWVPLGRRRRRARGFDQAEAVARAVGRLTGRPVRRLLKRIIETDPQARRTGHERRDSMGGAFAFADQDPAPAHVVLVDDVLTSGATLAECAGALHRAGGVDVGAVTVARSLNGPLPARCYDPNVLPFGTSVPPRAASSPHSHRGGLGRKGDGWTSC